MPAVVSLLRGVNVGGNHLIRMEDLRALYESLGFRRPQTYVQSGNVVFGAKDPNTSRLASRIEDAIEGRLGIRPRVVVRTADEMKRVVANNPFAGRSDVAASKLLVLFLAGVPEPDAAARISSAQSDPEELRLAGREVYAFYPNGIGRAKISPGLIEKILKMPATGRNWNTVTRLLSMAESFESGCG